MNSSRFPSAFVLVLGCLIGGTWDLETTAQDARPTLPAVTLKGLRERPQVELSVSPRTRVVTAPLDAQVFVTNLTDKDFMIERVELTLPAEMLAARGVEQDGLDRVVSNQHLKPGHQRIEAFKLIDAFSVQPRLRRLTFLPGVYDIRATVTYRVVPEEASNQVTAVHRIDVEPGLDSLIIGGILGSLLLGLFFLGYRMTRSDRERPAALLLSVLKNTVAGTVCSVVVILLLKRLQGVELPIKVVITDFYGALVIGLFSYKLGDWLYSLFTDEWQASRRAPEDQMARPNQI